VYDIAPSGSGSAYLTGVTISPDFSTTPRAFDRTYNGGYFGDAYVAKLNATGSGLAYSTFLGGEGDDEGRGLVIVGDGTAYVAGATTSRDFPTTVGAHDRILNVGQDPGPYDPPSDASLVRVGARGRNLIYSTYLGGRSSEYAPDVSLDDARRPYVIGLTTSPDYPTTPGAYDTTRSTFADVFVTRFSRA
jgi:hypothetical protein